jgi:hypothetical protein
VPEVHASTGRTYDPVNGARRREPTNRVCSILGCQDAVTARGADSYCSSGGHYGAVQRLGVAEVRRLAAAGLGFSVWLRPTYEGGGFVYVVDFAEWVKVGRTISMRSRLAAYSSSERERQEVLYAEWVPDPRALERFLLDEARRAGILPAHGREFFAPRHADFFLDLLRPIGATA